MKLLTAEKGVSLQFCIQGVELAFNKWEEKEGRAFLKPTELVHAASVQSGSEALCLPSPPTEDFSTQHPDGNLVYVGYQAAVH